MMDTATKMIDDDGTTYECAGDGCGYKGDTYCQNCGFAADES